MRAPDFRKLPFGAWRGLQRFVLVFLYSVEHEGRLIFVQAHSLDIESIGLCEGLQRGSVGFMSTFV